MKCEQWRGNRGRAALHPASSQPLDSRLFSMSVITPTRELLLALAKNIVDTE